MRRLVWIALLLPILSVAQKKQLNLEDVFKKTIFRDEAVKAENVGKLNTAQFSRLSSRFFNSAIIFSCSADFLLS